ncbi:PTS glucose transporter subunit IIA [Mycoplasmopsis sturni]|uniref:PTS glucose transporter subunit IIA n=1 Tax=Mycoplasmopsis sturni TaxID=39047 RepID=UPI00055EB254|nr:PTS glucose transporter subunit IIA [Mycoplasmopsis sturni]
MSQNISQKVKDIVSAFGGVYNIIAYNNCVSRLRYDVKNLAFVNVEKLKELGALDVIIFDGQKHVQAIFGLEAEELNKEIKASISKLKEDPEQLALCEVNEQGCNVEVASENAFDKSALNQVKLIAPITGEIVDLKDLNNEIIAQGLAGKGFAIKVNEKQKMTLLAPFTGTVTLMPASRHQLILKHPNGLEVLMLFGLDSYKLNGIGLNSKVQVNKTISQGSDLMEIEFDRLANDKLDSHIVFIVTNDSELKKIQINSKNVKTGEEFALISK